MDAKLKEALTRASQIAGTDLFERFSSVRDPEKVIQEARDNLAIARARKRFDMELDRQAKAATKETPTRRANRLRKSNKRQLEKLDKALKSAGFEVESPRNIPAHLWKQTQHILADSTGWAAKYYSKLCWHGIGVSLIHRAALNYDSDNKPSCSYAGTSRESLRARSVLALGLLLIGVSKPSGRHGQGWTRLVSGIPQAAILAALRDPFTGERPHRNTLDGTHRQSDKLNGDLGWLIALKRVGLTYTRQVKWRSGDDPSARKGWANIRPDEVASREKPGGWFVSLARYWIVTAEYIDVKDAARRAELYVAWLSASAYPEPVEPDTLKTREPEQETGSNARAAPS